jgi:hypothetical protein
MSKIALLPGGFKPPHAGHYNMAKWLAANTKANVLVRVGAKEREGITREMSLKLWELYTQNDNNIIVKPSVSNSPVRDVYDFVEQEAPEGSTVFLGMGEKDIDDKRFANINKFAEPRGINFETVLVPPQAGGVSGTQMREFIKNNDKDSFQKYIPNHINKEEAWDIVKSLNDDFYDPRNKYYDFAKSSEWKAGMPDGPKDDIPRKGDQIHNRQTAPVSWEESVKENIQYESRGNKPELHIYDFDETIARVETPIPYTVESPEGKMLEKGETTSIEFEEKKDKLKDSYDEGIKINWDFKAFASMIGKATLNNEVFKKLLNSIKNPNAKVTILTARAVGLPVTKFLKDQGIWAYVVPLGLNKEKGQSVTGEDKANWIENRIKKTTKKVLFIDDSPENRKAIYTLRDKYPNIEFNVETPPEINEARYYLDDSNIQGQGAFAQEDYPEGTVIDKLHDILGQNQYNFYELGKMYNHSDTPNCKNVMKDNTRYLVTIQPIKQGEELTADYKLQPDLEQPETHWQALNELEDNEIKFFALHADILKQLNTPNFKSKYQELLQQLEGERLEALKYFYNEYLSKLNNDCEIKEKKYGAHDSIYQHKDKIQSDYGHQQYRDLQFMISQQKDEEVETWLKTKGYMNETKLFSKNWWSNMIHESILTEGGAAGHMAHPFNLPNINSGKDLKNIFEKSAKSLQTNPGAVKIDGVNASIRLVDLDGVKQFALDRGSKKALDIKGVTKSDLEDRFKTKDGSIHGFIKTGGEVLDMFNEALPSLEADLKKLGAWNNPNILFNMEYVSGKTNVQKYDNNFIAIHGLNKIEMKEVQGKRGLLMKRSSSEISYDKSDLQSLLNNLAPVAKKRGFEVYGSVPTEMTKKPNFTAALSKNYSIKTNEGDKTQSLDKWLSELNDIPEKDFIFMDGIKRGAVSKIVYTTLLNGSNIDELFENEEDKQKAIEGFTTYLATEKLGDEILKVLDSPMGSADNHEGVVIRDNNISNVPFKITGKFILGGLATGFR